MKKATFVSTTLGLTVAFAATMFSATAHAQFQKPEDAVKYRQSALSVMGTHFGRIGAMVNGKRPLMPSQHKKAHILWLL